MAPLPRTLLAGIAVFLASAGTLYGQAATLTPNPQDFGTVVVGQSSSAINFIFTNNSSSSETVASVIPSNSAEFPVQPSPASTCPGIVPAHGGCTISIVFTPTSAGAASGQVEVNSTDAASPMMLMITGTGAAATTTATLTPGSAPFGSINVGSSSSSTPFTLTNTGNTTIGNISVGASGDYSATYSCSTLAPSATCTINVVFSPTAAGARNGTLTINSTSSSSPLTASLTGTGVSTATGLTLSTYAVSLGSYEVGAGSGSTTATQILLTNNDSTAITFSAPPFSGAGINFPLTGDFLDNNDCPQVLAAGAVCRLNVFFQPTTTGTRIGSLTVNSTASNGTQTLTLSGNGTDVTLAAASSTVTVVQGQTAVYSITFTPISGFSDTLTLSCSGLTASGTGCGGDDVTLGPTTTASFNVTTTPKNLYGVIGTNSAPESHRQTRTAGVIGLCSLLLLALAGRTRRLARSAGLITLLLAMLWTAGGCSGKQPTPDPNATLPGTYNFTLTTVDNARQYKTLALTLVVKSQ